MSWLLSVSAIHPLHRVPCSAVMSWRYPLTANRSLMSSSQFAMKEATEHEEEGISEIFIAEVNLNYLHVHFVAAYRINLSDDWKSTKVMAHLKKSIIMLFVLTKRNITCRLSPIFYAIRLAGKSGEKSRKYQMSWQIVAEGKA